MTYQITSESVTEGHPDKVCDQISDAILDSYLTLDPHAHVAIECMISPQLLIIAGEVNSTSTVDVEEVARKKLAAIGYTSEAAGMDASTCVILCNINTQSTDIAQGVLRENQQLGAGDQGIMYGYACRETAEYMPLPIQLAHGITKQLTDMRKTGMLPYLQPDGKSQVTVEYHDDGSFKRITDIIVSTQHVADISQETIRQGVIEKVILPILGKNYFDTGIRILVNPTGRFVVGGPQGDVGLTGRKIIVDTYGGVILHGGGAFSGKDATKLDRSGAYMARYACKNIVAAGLADRCQLSVSYAIGVVEPVSFHLETFGTEKIPIEVIYGTLRSIFDFTPQGIITTLGLRMPIYSHTASYGHFKTGASWENLDKVAILKELRTLLQL